MNPLQMWWCEDWIFFVKTKIQLLHHRICTSTIGMGIKWIVFLMWRCKDYIGSPPPSVSMYRVNPYLRTMLLITQNQFLHLRIDYRIRLIPISMRPVHFWRCEDWIFDDENKNTVTAPPDLHQCHWCGDQINCILNLEVQGLYRKSAALSIKV